MSSDQKRNRITFSQEQLNWLEQMFPETSGNDSADDLRYRAGQRSVLARIKYESRAEVRIVPVHRDL